MPTTKSSPHRLAIIGGSLAGLMAGNLFHRIGWDVHIFERTDGILEGRGAGITILPGLIETFSACGVPEQAYGIMLPERIALDRAGNIVAQRSFAQEMTSWRRLFEMLKAAFPSERYHGGVTLERIEQNAEKVTALFTNGQHIDADLLVGADGLRSGIRS
ncbi:MAG: FAD-dependent oxidoreductase, partial [Proteobacteria bacterium]